MSRLRSKLCLAIVALSATTFAQDIDSAVSFTPPSGGSVIDPSPTPGAQFVLGDLVAGPFNVSTNITASPAPGAAWNRLLGCARAWGYYWVSGGAGTTGAFMIHQYDLAGVYIQSFVQDVSNSAGTIWGARDLAVDEAAFKLWGGMENNQVKEYTFDPNTGVNGTLTFTTSYTVPLSAVITIRALARNPSTGNFFTKNFNSVMYEFDLSPLSQIAIHNSNGKATYGLAWDTVNTTMWQFDQFPAAATDACEFNEIDLTGLLTTRTFSGTLYGVANTNVAGGCDIFDDGSGVLKIVGLHQFTNDELNVYELDSTTPPPSTVDCQILPTATVVQMMCQSTVMWTGAPSASTGSFNVTFGGLNAQVNGVVFYGVSGPVNTVWSPESNLCVKAPTQRLEGYAGAFGNTGGVIGSCNGSYSFDFNPVIQGIALNPVTSMPYAGAPMPMGTTVDCQAWQRDPGSTKTTNLSDALTFTVGS